MTLPTTPLISGIDLAGGKAMVTFADDYVAIFSAKELRDLATTLGKLTLPPPYPPR